MRGTCEDKLALRDIGMCDDEFALVEDMEFGGGTSALVEMGTFDDKFVPLAVSLKGSSIRLAPLEMGAYDDEFTLAEEMESGGATFVLVEMRTFDDKLFALVDSLEGSSRDLAPREMGMCDIEVTLVGEMEFGGGTSVLVKTGETDDKFVVLMVSLEGSSIKLAPWEMGTFDDEFILVEEVGFGGGTSAWVGTGVFEDKFLVLIIILEGSALESFGANSEDS